jgi:CheY-like chemotaxis protein
MQTESIHSLSAESDQETFEQQTVSPIRILFVDDDDTIREAMVAILAWFGHETLSAARGSEAVEKYRSNAVDLVITDNSMPDMKGCELAEKLRVINPEAKIILLTGWNNEEKQTSSFINCTLTKPVTMQTVLDTIQNLFPKKK